MSVKIIKDLYGGLFKLNNRLVNQIKRHEGFRKKPYYDTVEKLTIGYGRNLDDIGISEEEAEMLLFNDLANAHLDLVNTFPIVNTLCQERKDVLINMCFNLGISKLSKFRKMWNFIINEDYDEAAKEMLDSKWATQVGYRAIELSIQMRDGKYAG